MTDITERTFRFSLDILKLFRNINRDYSADKNILSKQLLRSGTSIGANVEEAQSGQSRADFISKMSIALKEARETHYWLRLLAAAELVKAEDIADLIR
ncbi:MAG: four helix bundle protein [Pyrinomonadaceae bacterium]|nr:four helix bundle protein [Pyrinomonadaceae bacterium]